MTYIQTSRRSPPARVGRVGLFLYTPGSPQFQTAAPPAVPVSTPMVFRMPPVTGATINPILSPPVTYLPAASQGGGNAQTPPGGTPTSVVQDWLAAAAGQPQPSTNPTANIPPPSMTAPIMNADGTPARRGLGPLVTVGLIVGGLWLLFGQKN